MEERILYLIRTKRFEDAAKIISELIKEKNYPVEEVLWINFVGTTKWNFTFNY